MDASGCAAARGLTYALAIGMSLQQTPESAAQVPGVQSEGSLDGGLFVAGIVVGVAPAAAAAGIMLDSRLFAIGGTVALLLMGFIVAAVSSEL